MHALLLLVPLQEDKGVEIVQGSSGKNYKMLQYFVVQDVHMN